MPVSADKHRTGTASHTRPSGWLAVNLLTDLLCWLRIITGTITIIINIGISSAIMIILIIFLFILLSILIIMAALRGRGQRRRRRGSGWWMMVYGGWMTFDG